MTWFKENKFLAGLLVITGLLAALIIFLGLGLGTTLEEKKEEIATKESSLKDMKGLNPYPTPESAAAKRDSLKVLLDDAAVMQAKVLAFRPETIENIPIADFSAALTTSVTEIKGLFPRDKAVPESFNLGFETYANGPPKEGATGVLDYQRGAFDYLFRELAKAGVPEIVNLQRSRLPAEDGEDWDNPSKKKVVSRSVKSKPKTPAKGRRNAPKPEVLPEVAHRMPFELTFRAPEAAVRRFLESLANSDQYFFEARIARIKNEAPIPEAKKSKAPKADDSAEFGPIEGDEPAEDVAAPVTKILDRVSGGEELTVFLKADLLLFKDAQKFPELK